MTHTKIASRHNPLLKYLRDLALERSHRHASNLFLIEGKRFVEAALGAGVELNHLLVAEELADTPEFQALTGSCSSDVTIYSAPMSLIEKIAQTKNPQGVVATARMKSWDLASLTQAGRRLFLVMDDVTDPGNMGTMIRTADAAGFDGVILGPASVDLYNPKTLRATMGSIFHIPCVAAHSLEQALTLLKSAGIRLIATHLGATEMPYAIDLTRDAALIVGNEAHGVSPTSTQLADILVKIPMLGGAESLNASTAANILMYESVRQRTLIP